MIVTERLELLVLARLATSPRVLSDAELVAAIKRFTPATMTDAAWRDAVVSTRQRVVAAAADAQLTSRLGLAAVPTWAALAERILPGLALEIPATEAKLLTRLNSRDTWTAALGARLLGLWQAGPPPSLSAVCDAFVWRGLGLTGRAKRCPPEIRGLFLQRELASDPGPPDRLLRLYVARELKAPRSDARQLRDGAVRAWLTGRALDGTAPATMPTHTMKPATAPHTDGRPQAAPPATPTPTTATARTFAEDVRAAARTCVDGVFGDRKVFIDAAFTALQTQPAWRDLSLADFKQRLLAAHRTGEVVLARADLVAAMDPARVAASETTVDGATFHFIVREVVS